MSNSCRLLVIASEAIFAANTTSVSSPGSDRAIQYSEAAVLEPRRLWNTGFPAFAGNDSGGGVKQRSRGTFMPE